MRTYLVAGSMALSLVLAPAAALAHLGEGTGVSAGISADATGESSGTSGELDASVSAEAKSRERGSSHMNETRTSERGGSATSTERRERGEAMHEAVSEHLDLELESTTTEAFSLHELEKTLRERKRELDQEEASTSPEYRDVVKNANDVRLAVHALLAARPLLGGIGGEVSQVAQAMNRSVATTTDAEARIAARGFWTTLLFGGDETAAAQIKESVAKNEERIRELEQFLAQASASADVKAALSAQIAVLQAQEARLMALAQAQAKLWGLFSWRF